MIDLTKLTDDHVKHIAILASDNEFDFVELEITRDENHIKISEAKRRGLQELLLISNGAILRYDANPQRDTCLPLYIYNIIELGKYLEQFSI
jgi:hypothetical protein